MNRQPEFQVGDRVRTKTSKSRIPAGSVGTVTTSAVALGDETTVLFDFDDSKWFYTRGQLEKAARRLTISPTKATTAAVFDGRLTGPESIAAEAVVIEGEFQFEVEDVDTTKYVQVDYSADAKGDLNNFSGLRRYQYLYTYIDPSGELAVGDLVEVPVAYGTKVGVVVAIGRGDYKGACKTVNARLFREAL